MLKLGNEMLDQLEAKHTGAYTEKKTINLLWINNVYKMLHRMSITNFFR